MTLVAKIFAMPPLKNVRLPSPPGAPGCIHNWRVRVADNLSNVFKGKRTVTEAAQNVLKTKRTVTRGAEYTPGYWKQDGVVTQTHLKPTRDDMVWWRDKMAVERLAARGARPSETPLKSATFKDRVSLPSQLEGLLLRTRGQPQGSFVPSAPLKNVVSCSLDRPASQSVLPDSW